MSACGVAVFGLAAARAGAGSVIWPFVERAVEPMTRCECFTRRRSLACCTVESWALHPKSGVVLRFSLTEGYLRVKTDSEGTRILTAALERYAAGRRSTWTTQPVEHPLPWRFLDGVWPPRGLVNSAINLVVSAILTLLWPYWVASAVIGAGILLHCRRNSDTFVPGPRTWLMFMPPIVQFLGTRVLAARG